MQEFNQFQWHSEENTPPTPPSPQKKPRIWLIALSSALIGALVMSCTSPLVSRLIGGKGPGGTITLGGSFNFSNVSSTAPEVMQVTHSSDTRTELSTVEIGKRVGPAVVGIVTVVQQQSYSFFGQPSISEGQGSGSGIIISTNGYIVTNNHVIEGAKSIKVILNNGKEYDATVVGADSRTDIAVIKVDATDLPTATIGNSDILEAGERCVAIGNPLGQELAGSLTQGIISALNRTLTVDNVTYTLIQTDAAINPGNSGGALVNAYGEVIGINTVKIGSSEIEGLGFAIPTRNAMPIIEDLMNFGYVKGRPQIGVTLIYVTEQEARYYNIPCEGLFVSDVSAGSGAATAGIKKGDVILKCNGEEVKSADEINAVRDKFKAGDTITLTVNRDGSVMDIKVVLTEEKPSPKQ
ncbi:MAG: trypsin-like peptidase domain-containing protein [Clostridia bacterium]|nr:trypsin-like peptidase domain-containing protein [Clostridia bacterium]